MRDWLWALTALIAVSLGLGALSAASWKAGHAAAERDCEAARAAAMARAAAVREDVERAVTPLDDDAVLRALDRGGWLRDAAD